ncbi:MAG: hypothetical protein U9N85_01380 [Bacteroidota bacterium]|nr:hypothetical protein [Bacteroidota bacterium]
MKHITYYILALFFLLPVLVHAQPHKHHRDEITKRKKEFIKQELQLTETEEKALMPLYDALEKKKTALHKEHRRLIKSFDKNSLNLSDKEVESMNNKIVSIHRRQANLHEEYNKKFSAVLPPVKVFLLYKTEHDFKRILIREYRHRGKSAKRE